MNLKKYNYLILGLARSGISSYKILKNKKSKIFLYDMDKVARLKALENTKDNINAYVVQKLSKQIIDQVQVIVISPAFCIDNKFIKYAKSKGKLVISELELGYRLCKNRFIAITGTNGKTTTVKLLGKMFSDANKRCKVVGNVGVPVTSVIDRNTKRDTFVCEVSSFQLEAIQQFKPKIACILNIGVDHIDHHKTLKNYINAKFNIAKNLQSNDYLILNNNCKVSKRLSKKVNCKVFYFDIEKQCQGVYIKEQNIYINLKNKPIYITSVKNIKLLGKHNLENVLCAVLCAYICKINKKSIEQTIKTFLPLPHRLQKIAEFNGVEFINDSKATNIDSTLTALNSINKPITLILGGSDKGYNYEQLFLNLPKNVVRVVCCGAVKQKLIEASKLVNVPTKAFDTLKQATKYCFDNTKQGCVLLSPASASFDEFENYIARGICFEKYVREFIGEDQVK